MGKMSFLSKQSSNRREKSKSTSRPTARTLEENELNNVVTVASHLDEKVKSMTLDSSPNVGSKGKLVMKSPVIAKSDLSKDSPKKTVQKEGGVSPLVGGTSSSLPKRVTRGSLNPVEKSKKKASVFVPYGWGNTSWFSKYSGQKTKVSSDDLELLRKLPVSFAVQVYIKNRLWSEDLTALVIKSCYMLCYKNLIPGNVTPDMIPDRVICVARCRLSAVGNRSIEIEADNVVGFVVRTLNDDDYELLMNTLKSFSLVASLRDFEPLAKLAHGHFGRVSLVRHIRSNVPMALKEVPVRVDKPYKQFEERAILSRLSDCPLIARLLFSFREGGSLYFCTELGAGGDLWSVLRRAKKLSEACTLFIASEMLVVIEFLHAQGITHRDIKLENILIDHHGHLKVVDFGLSKMLTPSGFRTPVVPAFSLDNSSGRSFGDSSPDMSARSKRLQHASSKRRSKYSGISTGSKMYNRTYSMCGTNYYMPPEMLLGEGHSLAIDWWQLGCLIYECYYGVPCFYAKGAKKIHSRILEGPPNFSLSAISPAMHSVIMALLDHNQDTRLGANGSAEVKKHPFFFRVTDWSIVANRGMPIPADIVDYLKHNTVPGETIVDKICRGFPESGALNDFERRDSVFAAGGGATDSKAEDDDSDDSRSGGSSIVFRNPFSLGRKDSKNELDLRSKKVLAQKWKRKKAVRRYSSRKSTGMKKSSLLNVFTANPIRPEPYMGFEYSCPPLLLERVIGEFGDIGSFEKNDENVTASVSADSELD